MSSCPKQPGGRGQLHAGCAIGHPYKASARGVAVDESSAILSKKTLEVLQSNTK
jgi:hypothetical protein